MTDRPTFPVDPITLSALEAALTPVGENASTLTEFLDDMSELARGPKGPPTEIIELDTPGIFGEKTWEVYGGENQWTYHPSNVIQALIDEVKRLRSQVKQ